MVPKCALQTISSPFGKEFHVRSQTPNLGRQAVWIAALVVILVQVFGIWAGFLPVLASLVNYGLSLEIEKLIVWEGLGVTLESRNRMGSFESQFIEIERIKGVVVGEVMTAVSVHFYLILDVEGQQDLSVAFKGLKPRLDIVESVYHGLCTLGIA